MTPDAQTLANGLPIIFGLLLSASLLWWGSRVYKETK